MKVLDLGFYFTKVIRFYGLGYDATLNLPIDTFWLLVKNSDRHEAEDSLRALWIHQAGASQDRKGVQELMHMLSSRIGKPLVREEPLDRDGLNRLKNLGKATR